MIQDRYGRRFTYLRLSVTGRCNFRCQYCTIPKDHADLMSATEIVRVARVAVEAGVTKIRLTGGEPTVREDLVDIVREIAAFPGLKKLAMTTNGAKLAALARPLQAAGLQAVNVSLDSLHGDCFGQIAKGGDLESVMEGIRVAISIGLRPVKVNAVVMAGVNDREVLDFVALARELDIEVRFIEYMPMTPGEQRGWTLPYEALLQRIREKVQLEPLESDADAGPAELYRIEGGRGVVGFIHAMSNPFCSRCNRLRVTSEGTIRSCLLTGGEVDLLKLMRAGASDAQLVSQFREAAFAKPEVYDLHRDGVVAMRHIGG